MIERLGFWLCSLGIHRWKPVYVGTYRTTTYGNGKFYYNRGKCRKCVRCGVLDKPWREEFPIRGAIYEEVDSL